MKCVMCRDQDLDQEPWYKNYYRCPKCYRIFARSGFMAEQIEGIGSIKEAPPHV